MCVVKRLQQLAANVSKKGYRKEGIQIQKIVLMAQQMKLDLDKSKGFQPFKEPTQDNRHRLRKSLEPGFVSGLQTIVRRVSDLLGSVDKAQAAGSILKTMKEAQNVLQYAIEKAEQMMYKPLETSAQTLDVGVEDSLITEMVEEVKRAKDILASLGDLNTVTEILGNVQAAKQRLQLVENKARSKGYVGDYSNIKYLSG